MDTTRKAIVAEVTSAIVRALRSGMTAERAATVLLAAGQVLREELDEPARQRVTEQADAMASLVGMARAAAQLLRKGKLPPAGPSGSPPPAECG
jgi:hypothetical protein